MTYGKIKKAYGKTYGFDENIVPTDLLGFA